MNSNLEESIAGAPARLEEAEIQDEKSSAKRKVELADKEAKAFRNRVQAALGSIVLCNIGPVSYRDDPDTHAMSFQIDG